MLHTKSDTILKLTIFYESKPKERAEGATAGLRELRLQEAAIKMIIETLLTAFKLQEETIELHKLLPSPTSATLPLSARYNARYCHLWCRSVITWVQQLDTHIHPSIHPSSNLVYFPDGAIFPSWLQSPRLSTFQVA